jgi:hypothetical protein
MKVCKEISNPDHCIISVLMLVAGPDDKIYTVNDPEVLDTRNTSYWTWESRSHINPDTGLPHYEGAWIRLISALDIQIVPRLPDIICVSNHCHALNSLKKKNHSEFVGMFMYCLYLKCHVSHSLLAAARSFCDV